MRATEAHLFNETATALLLCGFQRVDVRDVDYVTYKHPSGVIAVVGYVGVRFYAEGYDAPLCCCPLGASNAAYEANCSLDLKLVLRHNLDSA